MFFFFLMRLEENHDPDMLDNSHCYSWWICDEFSSQTLILLPM